MWWQSSPALYLLLLAQWGSNEMEQGVADAALRV
jgi:hypothetical protein